MFIQQPINRPLLSAIAVQLINTLRARQIKPQTELNVLYAQAQNDPVQACQQIADIIKGLRITSIH